MNPIRLTPSLITKMLLATLIMSVSGISVADTSSSKGVYTEATTHHYIKSVRSLCEESEKTCVPSVDLGTYDVGRTIEKNQNGLCTESSTKLVSLQEFNVPGFENLTIQAPNLTTVSRSISCNELDLSALPPPTLPN